MTGVEGRSRNSATYTSSCFLLSTISRCRFSISRFLMVICLTRDSFLSCAICLFLCASCCLFLAASSFICFMRRTFVLFNSLSSPWNVLSCCSFCAFCLSSLACSFLAACIFFSSPCKRFIFFSYSPRICRTFSSDLESWFLTLSKTLKEKKLTPRYNTSQWLGLSCNPLIFPIFSTDQPSFSVKRDAGKAVNRISTKALFIWRKVVLAEASSSVADKRITFHAFL